MYGSMKFSDITVVRVGSQPGACQTGGGEQWHWNRLLLQYYSTTVLQSSPANIIPLVLHTQVILTLLLSEGQAGAAVNIQRKQNWY